MIYITGDTHRDFTRIWHFAERMQTTKEDVLVILGDSGLNYYHHLNERNGLLKRVLDKLSLTLLCLYGNHEQRPFAIPTYKEKEWHGGVVYVEDEHPSLLFAKDGEVYNLNDKSVIAIGGAYSIDKWIRLARGFAWYDNEQPSEEIKQAVEDKLEQIGWKVDYIFTHTCPMRYQPTEVFVPWVDQETIDKSTEIWLDQIEERLTYEKWYCGHFHIDKMVDRLRFMFDDIEVLE